MQQKIKDNSGMTITPNRQLKGQGGAGRGQGRKSLVSEGTPVRQWLSLTPQQHAKLKSLGGPAWVRMQIDGAAEPGQPATAS